MQRKNWTPFGLLIFLVFIAYGDHLLPKPFNQYSASTRSLVVAKMTGFLPKSAPTDGRYDRSWREVQEFDKSGQNDYAQVPDSNQ